MASSHTDLEDNLKCSICLDIFNDPVVLHCSHSFCKDCLEDHWRRMLVKACPLCRQPRKRHPVKNLSLKGACEYFVAEKRRRISAHNQGVLCDLHGLKHALFCIDDQKLVCLGCVSEDHKMHNFCGMDKAAEEHRNKLQKPLQELESKLQNFTSKKATLTTMDKVVQAQVQRTEPQIKEEFKKLYQLLREEEEARLSALRDEQKRKQEKIMENIAEVERLHASLSEQIKQIKDDLGHDAPLFLHNFRDLEERVKFTVPQPKLDVVSMIDVSKHMGNLRYKVWEKMKHLCPYYPVILDPNTKSRNLEVSPDLTSITCSGQVLLTSPEERFCYIVGSEGYSSGEHTWQVGLEHCEHWALGVVPESNKRLQNLSSCKLLVSCIMGKCSWTPVALKIKKVCVFLDMMKKLVVFSDPDTNVTMMSYQYKSTEKMYPCFFPFGRNPIKILPSV